MNSSEPSCSYDVVIIGAGAAGLMAAASAAARGLSVLLLEKNTKLGVKILMSGGTRCNITHDCGTADIIQAFGRQGRFLHSALAALPPSEVIAMVERQGVATKVEDTGKIFPVSNRAIDVRDAIVRLAIEAGAEIRTSQAVEGVEKTPDGFEVQSTEMKTVCRSLLVTTGGRSFPGCGTTGDGYAWAQQFGHSIVETVPALVPILNNTPWANELKGIAVEQALIKVVQPPCPAPSSGSAATKKNKPKTLVSRRGALLFTHFGFSGPAALDVSREIARHPDRKSLLLVCDFLPDQSLESFSQQLMSIRQSNGKQQAIGLLGDLFPRRLAENLLRVAGIDPAAKNAELTKLQIRSLAEAVKQLSFHIKGTLGFEKAEVTAGGVQLKEVDSKTMQSKLVPGLFFAGEVLDLDGYIGGFNFQSAFSTGWLAGQWV